MGTVSGEEEGRNLKRNVNTNEKTNPKNEICRINEKNHTFYTNSSLEKDSILWNKFELKKLETVKIKCTMCNFKGNKKEMYENKV